MSQIELCESILELLRAERIAREVADARVQDWQRQIKRGCCFKRSTPDGLEIYGEVPDDHETGYLRNFRVCRCYSIACPEGEIGDVHVSQMDALIDREIFEAVKNKLKKAWSLALKRLEEEADYKKTSVI